MLRDSSIVRFFVPVLVFAFAVSACGETESAGDSAVATAMTDSGESTADRDETSAEAGPDEAGGEHGSGEGGGEHASEGERRAGGEHGGEANEGGEHGGEHSDDGEHEGEHGGEAHDEEGEESGVYISRTATWDEARGGARLRLAYDQAADAFIGQVLNENPDRLCAVRVEVHLDNGVELGPTPQVDLDWGAYAPVRLSAEGQAFDEWTAHPEMSSCD